MRKLFEFNSIRSRMLGGFLALTFLILLIAAVSFYTLNNIRYTANIDRSINQLQAYTLILIKSDNDFFDLGAIDTVYFKTRHSQYLIKRDSLNRVIHQGLTTTLLALRGQSESIAEDFETIQKTLGRYNIQFQKLESLLYKKGFRDFGLEGVMRSHAHSLEASNQVLSIADVLTLRRHEKDFFLRHDLDYVIQLNDLAETLRSKLGNSAVDQRTLAHLNSYVGTFNSLVSIYTEIGIESNRGLRNELNELTNDISSTFLQLAEYSSNHALETQQKAFFFYAILLTVAILISLFSSFWLAKKLSSPIARLSRIMNQAVSEHQVSKIDFSLDSAAHEINTLTFSFIQLINEAKSNLKELEKKSSLLRQRNKQLKKLNGELDSFLYSTAHDLRSPLTSLLGLLHLAKKENVQPSLHEYFEMMESSIHRMEDFISQIVGYSKNKRLEMKPELIDLHQLAQEVFDSHRYAEGADRLRLEVEISGRFLFYSDKARVLVLMNNLVSNAVRYADPAKAQSIVGIRATVTEEELTLVFYDNGVGIAEEHIGKIFDMFYRASTKSKGSGLGLFIFKETITKLKGSVSVLSKLNEGSQFTIKLPNLVNQTSLPKPISA